MIRIFRGEEPDDLADAREEHLSRAALRGTEPTEADFVDYGVSAHALLARQFYKCAYCEMDVRERALPVEHVRPKGRATRVDWEALHPAKKRDALAALDDDRFGRGLPPLNRDRVRWRHDRGYWWLAWTWENHVMACGSCNSGLKQTYYPLRAGSPRMEVHDQLPGVEHALLIDPGRVDPMDHIVFEQAERWKAFPRDESPEGDWTIFVFHLNSPDLLDKYTRHATLLTSLARPLDATVSSKAPPEVCAAEWNELLSLVLDPAGQFLALTNDWLAARYPEAIRQPWQAVDARPLQRPELWLPGTARSPAARPPIPPRPRLEGLPDPLQHRIRVARHHRAREPRDAAAAPSRIDQHPWRAVAGEYPQVRSSATAEELAELFDLSVETTRQHLTSPR